jgi:carbohydrate kinase (thermoresistant glucokinase family)
VVVVIMGAAGAGKTTVGTRLARRLDWPFHDADDHHPPANVARMRAGVPLTDADREPWLRSLAALIGDHVRNGRSMVLACSALKRSHRAALLREAGDAHDVRLVLLQAPADVLATRLAGRVGHFFPGNLLPTQIEMLEPPDPQADAPVLIVDAAQAADDVVAQIRNTLRI